MTIRLRVAVTLAVTAAGVAGAQGTAAAASPPVVRQIVVFRDGTAPQSTVRARELTVKVGSRSCAVGAATPLAALVRSDVATLRLRDYGSCSSRARDAGGLYVSAIGPDRAKGQSGWVYKVGTKLAVAGAADPTGPFGRGRLKADQRITWFYCKLALATGACQPTLGLKATPQGGGVVSVLVRAYDDEGKATPAAGATVRVGDVTATTDDQGRATLTLAPGRRRLTAEKSGTVRSFTEKIEVG